MDPDATTISILTGGGTAGLILILVLNVWAFVNRKVITRGTFDDVVSERNEWKRLYLEESDRADQAVASVTTLTELVKDALEYLPEDAAPVRRRRR